MTESRTRKIERLLQDTFAPSELLIKDQSHLHAGHAGARDGKGHFEIRIVSSCFRGQTRLACHRMIYDALSTLMQTDIHALSITASAPADE